MTVFATCGHELTWKNPGYAIAYYETWCDHVDGIVNGEVYKTVCEKCLKEYYGLYRIISCKYIGDYS